MTFKVPKSGYWNAWALRASKKKNGKNNKRDEDKCVCGHPRFMHNKSMLFEEETFCKVHSCRGLEKCKKFRMKHKELSK